jgi:hypothetical protein
MIWIDACTVVNQHRKLGKNYSRLLSKNGGEFCNTVFVDWSSLCQDGSVLCYILMVGTTYIDAMDFNVINFNILKSLESEQPVCQIAV